MHTQLQLYCRGGKIEKVHFLLTVYPLLKTKHVSVYSSKNEFRVIPLSLYSFESSSMNCDREAALVFEKGALFCFWLNAFYIQGLSLMINNMWNWLSSALHILSACSLTVKSLFFNKCCHLLDKISMYDEQGCSDLILALLNRSDIGLDVTNPHWIHFLHQCHFKIQCFQ